MRHNGSVGIIWFVAGLGLGAAAGVILAPRSGAETRRWIGKGAGDAREYLSTHSHEYLERGRELYERGRVLADEAASLFEEGKRLMEMAEMEAERQA